MLFFNQITAIKIINVPTDAIMLQIYICDVILEKLAYCIANNVFNDQPFPYRSTCMSIHRLFLKCTESEKGAHK